MCYCSWKPTQSLRQQMLRSFGSTTAITLIVVVATAGICASIAGDRVRVPSDDLLRKQVVTRLVRNSLFVSETIAAYFEHVAGTVTLVTEVVQDRIVGYPEEGWEDDEFVPFRDQETGTNRYPLQAEPLPLDWQLEFNINEENFEEHVQTRQGWRPFLGAVSSSPSFFMQGVCDPDETNVNSPVYYPKCSEENNNVTSGGVVQPTPTARGLYQKSADIGWLALKPFFEAQPQVSAVVVNFHNSGAGASLFYPGSLYGVTVGDYISGGCEWMLETVNPFTGQPLGTKEEVARCHPRGSIVPVREFNPMEREWVQQISQQHDRVSWQPLNLTQGSIPGATVGRAAFDRRTGHFIGCVSMVFELQELYEIVLNATHEDETCHKHTNKNHGVSMRADVSIIKYSDNIVFADSLAFDSANRHVVETGLISQENLALLRNSVNFTSSWTPAALQTALEDNVIFADDKVYTVYPIPLPPSQYDPSYEPEYLVIHAISCRVLERMNDEIQREVRQIIGISFLIGLCGMALTYAILWFVSKGLTDPLLWIKRVAYGIVNHDDKRSADSFVLTEGNSSGPKVNMKWAPNTEIEELVREFRAMIKGFSGEGAATLAKPETFEIPNQLTWQSVYQQLYARSSKAIDERKSVRISSVNGLNTNSQSTPSPAGNALSPDGQERRAEEEAAVVTVNEAPPLTANNLEVAIVPAPPKKNRGPNVLKSSFRARECLSCQLGRNIRTHRSSLFWWMFLLIALPLILTNMTICSLLSIRMIDTVGDWVGVVANSSQTLEFKALKSSAHLKAAQASMSVNDVVRDLYFMTRVAGWLMFGGLTRSDSFTTLQNAANECRGYNSTNLCPVYNDFERTPCDCAWEDLSDSSDDICVDVDDAEESRSLQERFIFCQAQDADEATGRRDRATSFFDPNIVADISPETTLFWEDFDAVPGASKGSEAAGFETTYDRVRVSSAMAVAEIPLYNYASVLGNTKHFIASYTALDADGMMIGYRGCQPSHVIASSFQSDEENRAGDIAPDLCPLGKFGFDPRCRDWYATGRKKYKEEGTPVHITAPYKFASEDAAFAASATSPIVNPRTGEYAGHALLDFFPSKIKDIFNSLEDTIAFVITPEASANGGDTVLGPDRFEPGWSWKEVAIGELLFPDEPANSTYRVDFETDLLLKMKLGESGLAKIQRMRNGSIETLQLAFEPVFTRVLLPLDPSDLSRGANRSDALVYSIGLAYRKPEIEEPWQDIELGIIDDLERLRCIYLSIVGIVSLMFCFVTFYITIKICRPMLVLLCIVQSINQGKIEDDIPPLKGGSSEVHQVYNCFSKLYKIVRISNVAFFSGNLGFAYRMISDALTLFRKIGDEKAIGIACNNLGNTLHAVCKQQKLVGECCIQIPGICALKMALQHYDESISIARNHLDEAFSDERKAEFTQQLADRIFNRSMFLLLVANDKCAPPNARTMALSDIERVRRMDDDVKDFWIDRKLLLGHSEDFFLRILQRASGLLEFYDDAQLRSLWDANDLVGDADRFLFAAWDQPTAALFQRISRIGRLQQLETVAMRLDLCRGRTEEAACLAMRKFAEDEFLIEESFIMSSTVLLTVLRDDAEWSGSWTSKAKSSVRADLRKMLRTCKQSNLDIGKCIVFAMEINERWHGHPLLERINVRCLELYDELCLRDDYMGLVAYTTQGDLNVQLSEKAENEGLQRTSLDLATTTTSEQVCPSFALAMQMLIDSPASSENDSFVIVLTDGYSWDSDVSAQAAIKAQLDRMNRDRETKMHVIILGMDVEEEETIEQCKMMCTLTKQSLYVDIDENNVDSVFDEIGSIIRGEKSRNVNQQGLTMEKF